MAHEDYSCEIRPGQACASVAVFGRGSSDSYRVERSLRLAPEWACLWQGCRSPPRLAWVGAQSQPHPNEVHEAVLFKRWIVSRFLCNPKVHYCVHNIWPLFLIQSNSTLSNPICLRFVLVLSWLLPSDVKCVSTNTYAFLQEWRRHFKYLCLLGPPN